MVHRALTICLALAAFVFLAAPRTKADEIFTWTLPASPTVSIADPGTAFEITGFPLSENGLSLGDFTFDFFNISDEGGFDAFVMGLPSLLNEFGPQVYTGSENAPTFSLGTFGPFDGAGTASAGLTATLTISDAGNGNDLFTYDVASTSTPEPGSLLLLGTGALGLLGFARRKLVA